jgi:hypothetical protein
MRPTWLVFLSLSACGNIDPDIAPSNPRWKLAREAFSKANSITLYSVAADRFDHFGMGRAEASSPADALAALDEGDGVFGSIVIDDADTLKKIRNGFFGGYQRSEVGAFCYLPHHVLRLRGDGVDLQIHLCFECYYATVLDAPATKYEAFNDRKGLKDLLDAKLAAAKIPVREPWKPFELPKSDRDYVTQELGNDLVAALESADRLEVFTIDPNGGWDLSPRDATPRTPQSGESMRLRLESRKNVFGSTVIERGAVRAELTARLLAGIRPDANAAKCFLPRHGLVFTQGTRTIVVLVCFECDDLYIYDAEQSELIPHRDVGGLKERLEGILKARGVPLAP